MLSELAKMPMHIGKVLISSGIAIITATKQYLDWAVVETDGEYRLGEVF